MKVIKVGSEAKRPKHEWLRGRRGERLVHWLRYGAPLVIGDMRAKAPCLEVACGQPLSNHGRDSTVDLEAVSCSFCWQRIRTAAQLGELSPQLVEKAEDSWRERAEAK